MVPSLSLLLLAGFSTSIVKVTSAPAGITTVPLVLVTASSTVAVKVSPALLVRDVSARVDLVSTTVPALTLRMTGGRRRRSGFRGRGRIRRCRRRR